MPHPTPYPAITALFRVVFDQKVGYTFAYRRSCYTDEAFSNHIFEGVEFKCLPSGLHRVKDDTVYFTHTVPGSARYAGISVFLQAKADDAHRGASFVAIGALVKLDKSNGRLGRIWKFREDMLRIAQDVIELDKESADSVLEDYWNSVTQAEDSIPQAPTLDDTADPPATYNNAKGKGKRKSSSTEDTDHRTLGKDHPSLSIPILWKALGPLIFPLYRAALIKKRILLIGSPPVLDSCNFVYALSVLSTIPPEARAIAEEYETDRCTSLPTLFSVGVHDLPDLEKLNRQAQSLEKGWVATTTDDILATKRSLYDCCLEMPSHHPPLDPSGQDNREWPILRSSDGMQMRASPRDLQRWRILSREMRISTQPRERYQDDPRSSQLEEQHEEEEPLITTVDPRHQERIEYVSNLTEDDISTLVESQSWTQAAFDSLRWFTSPAEIARSQQAELELDNSILPRRPSADHIEDSEMSDHEESTQQAQYITRYFHNFSKFLQQQIQHTIQEADEGSHDASDPECDVLFTGEDLARCGFDVSRDLDCLFVVELASQWFGRRAEVEAPDTWEVCGMRVC